LGLPGALDMLLTGRRLGSQEALAMGLVNQIVPREGLLQAADDVARKIASFDPVAVRNAKQAVLRGLDMSLEQGLELEWRLAEKTKR
jgi:enoyl-CoA hydratase/carnithine racemase